LTIGLPLAGIDAGPGFRPVDGHSSVASERLSGEAVSLIIKERVAATGIDAADFFGHSLRAGFATSAAQAGSRRSRSGHRRGACL
jgi:hypothetical protein